MRTPRETASDRREYARGCHQIIMAPVGAHSAKPDEARRRIERLVLGPYLELFARQKTDGWFAWGNEIPAEEDHPAMARRRRGHPSKIKTQLEAAE
jgi:N6-adenosine-specific RNA methylase IME4